jgi:hypothetical protein
MAVFEVDSYVLTENSQMKHEKIVQKIFDYGKKHPEVSKYVKSLRFFRQGIGGEPVGRFVLMTEFECLSNMEKFYTLLNKDEQWQRIKKDWASVIDSKTMNVSLWNDRLRNRWVEKKTAEKIARRQQHLQIR